MTLEGLHDVIQPIMGWADCPLHHFQFGDVMYDVPSRDDPDMNDGCKIELSTLLIDGERVFQYLHDHGDSWCCILALEAVAPAIPGVDGNSSWLLQRYVRSPKQRSARPRQTAPCKASLLEAGRLPSLTTCLLPARAAISPPQIATGDKSKGTAEEYKAAV
jgi:hypothetical protein